MFGINVDPSTSFMQKFGMGLNAAAQGFGGPMKGAARMTGGMYDPKRKVNNTAGGGTNTPGNQAQTQNGPGGMRPQGPTPFDSNNPNPSPNTGMVRPPSFMFNPGMRLPNTGVTGMGAPGMGMPGMMRPQVMPPMAMTGMPGGGPMTGSGGDGSSAPSQLWQTYGNLAGQNPQRQMFY